MPRSAAPLFAALGDETRLQLIARLSTGGPLSIANLTAGFPMTRQAITKHLRLMEQAGLVRSTAQGRESLWQLESARITEARRHLERISSRWDERLLRLKRFVEREDRPFAATEKSGGSGARGGRRSRA
jgi:DNA-binding transcriptional ArsR family regulator